LKDIKREELKSLLGDYLDHPKVLEMKSYIQHGNITTYDHCRRVAAASLKINRKLHLGADEKKLAVGAMLHDFYLYDWHAYDDGSHRLHGFRHPEKARMNASEVFHVGKKEQDIIRTHMWPLTLHTVPRSREAVIVCMADKWCSLQETIFMRKKGK
jgi:uncharacterized protein